MEKEYRIVTTLFNVHYQPSSKKYSKSEAEKEYERLCFETKKLSCEKFIKYSIVEVEDKDSMISLIDKIKLWIKGE